MSFRCGLCVALLVVGLASPNAISRPDQADPRRRSLETLRRALREAREWKKVHAAEALIWTGYPQGVKEAFTSELTTADPGYSIGVWRVLARLEPKGTPNYKMYLDKIRRVATGPDGDKRVGALETLGKLGYAGRDAETIEAAKRSTGLLPIVARWVLANSGKLEDETRLAELLDMKEPLERGIVGYALRWLPKLRPSTLSKLKATVEKEPEDSVGRVYLVAALYVHASQNEDRQWARQELLEYIAAGKGEEKYEAASVFGRWGEREDIPRLLPLLDDLDFDVQIGGAYAILTIDRRFPQHAGVWRDDTFEDFAAGTFGSAGANLYVSRKGCLQTIHHWDYNADGYIDLVFNSTHDTAFQLPATIYAGSRNGLSSQPVAKLPSNGGQFATTGDLNGDGYTDIVLVNGHNGIHQETGLFIYWGAKEGYSAKRRSVLFDDRQVVAAITFRLPNTSSDGLAMAFSGERAPVLISAYAQCPQAVELPIREVTSLAADGGYLFAVSKGSVRRFRVDEYGHVLEDRTLPGEEVSRVLIRDLDGDGRSDLIYLRGGKNAQWLRDGDPGEVPRELPVSASVALAVDDFNKDGKPDIAAASAEMVVVCTATGEGFQYAAELPIGWATALAVGDGNGDGWPDLAVARGRDEDSYEAESWVFWGGKRGFSSAHKSVVRTEGANDVLCADFTHDGIDDLLFVNRVRGRTAGDVPVMVYWGGPGGKYRVHRRTLLPTIGGYASVGTDLNDDGYVDLIEFCGYDDDPYNERGSMIFWGRKGGLALQAPSFIPTKNALFGSVADLNRDGYLDLVVSEFHVSDIRQGDLKILWGGEKGYMQERTTSLKFPGLKDPRGTLIADLNRDGQLDIVATDIMQTACVIYWGHPN
ncbi:MAG TPA: VCBS repeat-containing protein, partial [Chthonomonadales bacterium]|nr:VCBS repeat-containing protein [Chthonomonadales bacterium]